MTTGLSGSYAFNGTDWPIEPTEGRWLERPVLGVDGNGHNIYPALRSFEATWALIPLSNFQTFYNAYATVSNTGTATTDLPQYDAADYRFARYSGTIVHEPTVGAYFNEHVTDVRLLITNIRL